MKPATLIAYKVEPARGVVRSSGLAVSTIVLMHVNTEGGQYVTALSPADAMQLGLQLCDAAKTAQADNTA